MAFLLFTEKLRPAHEKTCNIAGFISEQWR
jgi:hypothetical protein